MATTLRVTQRRRDRNAEGMIVARLLGTSVAVAGVLIYGPGVAWANGARESLLPSTVSASRAPLHAEAAGPLPKAWTGDALYRTRTTAIVTAEINAENQRTRFKFQYGLTRPYAYTTQVGEREVVGHVTDGVSEALGHLKPGMTYHFRIIAFNKYGFVVGQDRTFKTLKGNDRKVG